MVCKYETVKDLGKSSNSLLKNVFTEAYNLVDAARSGGILLPGQLHLALIPGLDWHRKTPPGQTAAFEGTILRKRFRERV